MLGQRFLHPKLGFAFEAPEGFALENQSAALIGVGEGGAQALRLDSIEASDSTSAGERARLRLDRRGADELDRDDQGRATCRWRRRSRRATQWSFRLGAVRLGGRIFRLIFAAHSLTPAVDARFRASIRSFHRLKPEEAARGAPVAPAGRRRAARRDRRRVSRSA